jgi:hypothetical protein
VKALVELRIDPAQGEREVFQEAAVAAPTSTRSSAHRSVGLDREEAGERGGERRRRGDVRKSPPSPIAAPRE